MLRKVRSALIKRLKPLKFAEEGKGEEQSSLPPVTDRSQGLGLTTDLQIAPPDASLPIVEQETNALPEARPELRLIAGGAPEETTQEVAPRNSLIEFFGKLRASRFPVFKWFAVTAYAVASKAARSNGRRKKGILVDRNFE